MWNASSGGSLQIQAPAPKPKHNRYYQQWWQFHLFFQDIDCHIKRDSHIKTGSTLLTLRLSISPPFLLS